jgi:hypothetical protein
MLIGHGCMAGIITAAAGISYTGSVVCVTDEHPLLLLLLLYMPS